MGNKALRLCGILFILPLLMATTAFIGNEPENAAPTGSMSLLDQAYLPESFNTSWLKSAVAPLQNISKIAAGEHHVCALTTQGGVKCWGGKLANGTGVDNAIPVEVSGLSSGMIALAAGFDHTCALTAQGGVKCWGDNKYGQLGDGTINNSLTPVDVSGLSSGATALAAGWSYNCALTAQGGVKCWGDNEFGQLGDGTATDRSTPVDVSGLSSGATALAAGYDHTCAVTAQGSVKCWGDNKYGQLGDGTINGSLTPVDVSGLSSGVTTLAAGASHTCAVTAQGGMKCWGWNQFGQLGDGTTTNISTPVDVFGLSGGVTALAASSTHTCALTAPGGIKCWGTNYAGELGDGTTNYSHTPVDVSGLTRGVVALAAGDQLTCAVTAQGGVKCWGGNAYGELGNGTTINSATPVFVSGLSSGMKALSAGGFHTCALTAQGGVMCWGGNGSGQLGDGTDIERNTPRVGTNIGISPTEGPPIGISTPVVVSSLSTGATALAAGSAHTCALTAKGGVKCWGGNADGELGNGTTINSATPVDVSGLSSGVKEITAGGNHTCVLTKQGGVKCWGSNGSGQLGNGTTINSATPVEVFGLSTGVKALAAGSTHTCALTAQGGVKCWGDNESGQLGDGTNIENNTPVDVSGLSTGVTSLAAGENYTCAVTAPGGVKCWGTDIHGRKTGVTTFQSNTPMDVSGLTSGVKELAAGGMHTCALTMQGGVKCWGLNNDGQLGDGTNDDASKPVEVSRLTSGAKQLAAGGFHTCALTAQGGVMCWGDNEFGQLGIGILHYSTTPVDVVSGEEPSTSASGAAGKPICTPFPMALFPALAGLVFWRQRAKRRIHS